MIAVIRYDPEDGSILIKVESGQGYVVTGKRNSIKARNLLGGNANLSLSEVYHILRNAGISSKRIISI